MSTFALKVSIDDSKYIIRGIDKGSSTKEILCILAKYKRKEELPDLQLALSNLHGAVSIIKCKKKKKNDDEQKNRHLNISGSVGKKKKTCDSVIKGTDKACSNDTLSNDNKNKSKARTGIASSSNGAQNVRLRKKTLISRSHSLNEKDRKSGKFRLRERPRSFGTFDATKIIKIDHSGNDMQIGNSFYASKKYNKRKKCENSVKGDKEKSSDEKISSDKNEDESLIRKLNINPRNAKTQFKQNRFQNWLENLKRNSITYFIEDIETKLGNQKIESTSIEEKGEANEIGDYENKRRNGQQCYESSEYAEAETDSGLPSLDYESSLDTLSRDDRISLEQSFDEEKMKGRQNDSGFDCSSCNETIVNANLTSHGFVIRSKHIDGVYEGISNTNCCNCDDVYCKDRGNEEQVAETWQNNIKEDNEGAIEGNVNDGTETEMNQVIDDQTSESAFCNSETNKNEVTENDLLKEMKRTVERISKTDEDLLHSELLISQLEFQLDTLSENADNIEDIEIEIEEMKLISELKETEEFLKAITRLSQYQREAQSEMMAELFYLDGKIKEKQIRLQSLERKLLREKFKSIPRHLSVSKDKILYSRQIESKVTVDVESNRCNDKSDAISLV